jgi:hypothetical protein
MRETELSPIFRKGGSAKELIRFGASLNVVWNLMAYKVPMAVKEKNIRYVVGMLAATGIANIAVAAMRGAFNDGEDDKRKDAGRLVYHGLAEGWTAGVPYSHLSNMAGWAAERVLTGEKSSPMQSMVFPLAESSIKGIVNLSEGEWGKAAFDALNVAGYATGLPSGQVRKEVKRAQRVIKKKDVKEAFPFLAGK